MFKGKTVHLAVSLVFYSSLTVFGQWSAANSGTTNNLNGGYLLDSGIGFVVGDAGTILKTTDAGMTWSPLTSGTTNGLYDVYFFDATQGVAVGEQGLILRTTDGGARMAGRHQWRDGYSSIRLVQGSKRNLRWRFAGYSLFDRRRRFMADKSKRILRWRFPGRADAECHGRIRRWAKFDFWTAVWCQH